jgi:hypothetical protein
MTPQHPTKRPVRLFYRDSIECLQALLSHPLFESHISFVPQRVWTSAAKICRIYDQWLSGDRAWSIQVGYYLFLLQIRTLTCTKEFVAPWFHSSGRGTFL